MTANKNTLKRKRQRNAARLLAKQVKPVVDTNRDFMSNIGTLVIGLDQDLVGRTTVQVVEASIKRNLVDSLVMVEGIDNYYVSTAGFLASSFYSSSINGQVTRMVGVERQQFDKVLRNFLSEYLASGVIDEVIENIEVCYAGSFVQDLLERRIQREQARREARLKASSLQ